MRTLNAIRSWFSNVRQQAAKYSVRCDETGLTQIVQRGGSTETFLLTWNEVTSVIAYKRDCFSVDQIRLLIEGTNDNRCVEVTEEDDGYKRLIEEMPVRLRGFPLPSEWWEKVALPPFELCWTQLYTREAGDEK